MTSTQCISCQHYRMGGKCDAYPEGIPYEIISGQVDHKEPYKGDNGIIFEDSEKIKINKSEKVTLPFKRGELGFAFIPQVYDNKKLEDKVVDDSSTWMKKVQKDLEKELKQFYGEI